MRFHYEVVFRGRAGWEISELIVLQFSFVPVEMLFGLAAIIIDPAS